MKTRNFAGIQFEELRRELDPVFNEVHDKLSDCYYARLPFSHEGKDYGVLDKATFDKLHGLLWHWYDVEFHKFNKKRSIPYSEEQYNEIPLSEDTKAKRHELAIQRIALHRAEGLELKIKTTKVKVS